MVAKEDAAKTFAVACRVPLGWFDAQSLQKGNADIARASGAMMKTTALRKKKRWRRQTQWSTAKEEGFTMEYGPADLAYEDF